MKIFFKENFIFNFLKNKSVIFIYLLPFFLISWSEQFIQSNTTGLLMSVGPIFALILAHFMTHDDKFSLQKMIAILVGLIGVLFIFGYLNYRRKSN